MKKILILFALASLPLVARASDYDEEVSSSDFGARLGAEASFKPVKGLTLSAGDEIRLYDNLSSLTRNTLAIGADYKLLPWLKVGAGYQLISKAPDSSSETSLATADEGWSLRHRFTGDLTGSLNYGLLKFSLRERFQSTMRTDDFNAYQSPKNELVLRSRLKISYELPHKPFSPYLYAEAFNRLNGVDYSSLAGNTKDTPETNVVTYDDSYLYRVRLALGTSWAFDSHNGLDCYLMYNIGREKDIDASAKGVSKSLTLQKSSILTVGLSYTFDWKKRSYKR